MRFRRKKFLIVGVLVLAAVVWYVSLFFRSAHNSNMLMGVSFDDDFSVYLGQDWQKAFSSTVDDLGFKYIRLSSHWDDTERKPGTYDFSRLDWLMKESEKRGLKIMLAVGQKTPRWPECHVPAWAEKLSRPAYDAVLKRYITAVVERYKDNLALEIWQVENEPFLPFGNKCVYLDNTSFKSEIETVKQLDPNHPTLVSDSGELSPWFRTALAANLFGTTMYRVVWNSVVGYWNYDWLPPAIYRTKLWVNRRSLATAYITELQGEPWIPSGTVLDTPLQEQYKSMDLARLKKNIIYAQNTGLPRAYLWGAEWWLWLRDHGTPEFSDYIKQLDKHDK